MNAKMEPNEDHEITNYFFRPNNTITIIVHPYLRMQTTARMMRIRPELSIGIRIIKATGIESSPLLSFVACWNTREFSEGCLCPPLLSGFSSALGTSVK